MTYLIDTDWAVEYLKGRPAATQLLQALQPQGLAISMITFGEIYEGIYFGTNPQQSERSFKQFLRVIDVIPLSRQIMRRFARLRGELRRQGMLIADPDLLIAATAIHHGLTLLTHNTRHFERIPNLTLYRHSGRR